MQKRDQDLAKNDGEADLETKAEIGRDTVKGGGQDQDLIAMIGIEEKDGEEGQDPIRGHVLEIGTTEIDIVIEEKETPPEIEIALDQPQSMKHFLTMIIAKLNLPLDHI